MATTELELMLCLGNNILTRQTHLFNIKAALGDFSDTLTCNQLKT